jgi:SAM-dependent methyltransferase
LRQADNYVEDAMSGYVTTSQMQTVATIPPAISITHQHLLACLNTLVRASDLGRPLRILDVGCGNGELIAYISAAFPILQPGCEVEIFGMDVVDSAVQSSGFFSHTLAMLYDRFPMVDWDNRLSLVNSREAWSYPADHFDFIVSNQVLEHVADHARLFSEIRRVLQPGSFSVHLFPVIHYLQEGHIHIPLAHRINGHGLLRSYIKLMSRIGFGSYREHQRKYGMTLDQYAEEHADYLTFMTNYLTGKQLLTAAKHAGLRSDFRFTSGFYEAKARAVLRRSPVYQYRATRPWLDALTFFFLKRVSSVTFVLEKKQSYAR